MKILFKNTTKYDKENCNNFITFHTNKYGKKELLKYLLMGICIIYILIFNLINKNWILILGLILLGVILYILNTKKVYENKKQRKRIKQYTFYFYEK